MIEIAPRPKAEPKKSVQIFLYFSLVLLVLTVASYFAIGYFYKEKTEELEVSKAQLAIRNIDEINTLRSKLVNYKEKIDDFNILISSRRSSVEFFEFLEKNTHPRVEWGSVELFLLDGKFKLYGKAESFSILTQQLLVFKNTEEIEKVELGGLNLSRGGTEGIDFSLNFTLNHKAFFK